MSDKARVFAGDVFVVLGTVSLAVGLWWIYPPVSLVVVGVLFVAVGIRITSPAGEAGEEDEGR